jgi:tetratricopeptide (TPR) repeat protein
MGTQLQIQSYGRGLQTQGHYEEALALFRDNIKKDPNSWIAHNEAARIAVARGDYDTAIKEMKLALSVAPETFRGQINRLITQLENKVDINK